MFSNFESLRHNLKATPFCFCIESLRKSRYFFIVNFLLNKTLMNAVAVLVCLEGTAQI